VAKRVHVFSDAAWDLTFKTRDGGISRYFMIGPVAMEECSVGDDLTRLRRQLAWAGVQLDQFHARVTSSESETECST
jgi:hypothetical protein